MGKTESFEFLNELALAFRRGEKNARPQHTPILEGVRAVLAHLTATGRLIPPGGMALTAERVEDVRTAREELRGYRNFTGYGRSHVNQLIAAVDALFPATEPAEELKPISWYRTMTPEFATAHFGFPDVSGLFERTHTGSDGGTWGWGGGDWELLVYPSVPVEPAKDLRVHDHDPYYGSGPEGHCRERMVDGRLRGDCMAYADPASAVPAEEETKAEHNASVARREALGRVAQQLYEQSFDGCDDTFYHDFGRALEDFLPSQGWTRIPASLPVVPAPTETGPWETWDQVPDGVWYRSANPTDGAVVATWANAVGRRFTRGVAGEIVPSWVIDANMPLFAPFVSAEEKDA